MNWASVVMSLGSPPTATYTCGPTEALISWILYLPASTIAGVGLTVKWIGVAGKLSVTVLVVGIGCFALAPDAGRASATDATSITPTARHLLLPMGILRLLDSRLSPTL